MNRDVVPPDEWLYPWIMPVSTMEAIIESPHRGNEEFVRKEIVFNHIELEKVCGN